MRIFLVSAVLLMLLSAAGCGGGESAESDDAAVAAEPDEADEGVKESSTDNGSAPDSLSDIEIVQGRPMADIRLELRRINQVLEPAYEELLENNPTASGLIEVNFSITPDGSVTDIVVSPDESLASLASGVEESISAISFETCPEQEENIPITVPIYLIHPE